MSQFSRGIFGAIAISLALGVASFAAGRDFTGNLSDNAGTLAGDINRAAKTDRAPVLKASAVPMRTISLRLDNLSDTSILVRIPLVRSAGNDLSALPPNSSGDRKVTEACEPVVSVLTEVAKHLQPGRCVT